MRAEGNQFLPLSSPKEALLTSLIRKTVTGHSGALLEGKRLEGEVFLAGGEFESLTLSRKLTPVARRREFWKPESPGGQTSREDPENSEPIVGDRITSPSAVSET